MSNRVPAHSRSLDRYGTDADRSSVDGGGRWVRTLMRGGVDGWTSDEDVTDSAWRRTLSASATHDDGKSTSMPEHRRLAHIFQKLFVLVIADQ